MVRTYAQLLRDRDNFIYAAINTQNEFMKKLWIFRANCVIEKIKAMEVLSYDKC